MSRWSRSLSLFILFFTLGCGSSETTPNPNDMTRIAVVLNGPKPSSIQWELVMQLPMQMDNDAHVNAIMGAVYQALSKCPEITEAAQLELQFEEGKGKKALPHGDDPASVCIAETLSAAPPVVESKAAASVTLGIRRMDTTVTQ